MRADERVAFLVDAVGARDLFFSQFGLQPWLTLALLVV